VQKLVEVLDKFAKDNSTPWSSMSPASPSPVLWAASSVNVTKELVDAYNTQSGVAAPQSQRPLRSLLPSQQLPPPKKP